MQVSKNLFPHLEKIEVIINCWCKILKLKYGWFRILNQIVKNILSNMRLQTRMSYFRHKYFHARYYQGVNIRYCNMYVRIRGWFPNSWSKGKGS